MPALPSKDISTILVRSLQNALSADSGGGDDELPDKIAEGINRSDLVGGQKKGGVAQNGEGNAKSPIDNLLKGGETARTKAYEKHLKKEEDAEKKARQERLIRDRNIEKAFDTTLRGLSTFAQNPLKGLDNALQAGFKNLFKFGDKLLNTSVKDVANGIVKPFKNIKNGAMNAITTTVAVGKVMGGGIARLAGKSGVNKGGETKQEKDEKSAKEGKVEKKRDQQAKDQLAETAKTNLTVGMIFAKIALVVAAIAAIAVLVPIIVGKLADLVLSFKYAAKETPVKFGAFMLKAKAALFGGLYDLVGKLKWPWGGGSLLDPSLSKEEKAEKEELSQNEMVKSYINAQTDAERYKKVMESDEYQKRKEMYERGEMSEMDKAHFEKEETKMKRTFENLKFYEGTAVVKRWNELNLDPTKAGERMMAEAEDWEDKEYGKLYKGMLERGELTAANAAWAVTKGGAAKSQSAMQAIKEHIDSGGTFAEETSTEAVRRKGLKVAEDLANTFGELAHNLVKSTKEGSYKRKNWSDSEGQVRDAINNYNVVHNNVTTSTPNNMGT